MEALRQQILPFLAEPLLAQLQNHMLTTCYCSYHGYKPFADLAPTSFFTRKRQFVLIFFHCLVGRLSYGPPDAEQLPLPMDAQQRTYCIPLSKNEIMGYSQTIHQSTLYYYSKENLIQIEIIQVKETFIFALFFLPIGTYLYNYKHVSTMQTREKY